MLSEVLSCLWLLNIRDVDWPRFFPSWLLSFEATCPRSEGSLNTFVDTSFYYFCCHLWYCTGIYSFWHFAFWRDDFWDNFPSRPQIRHKYPFLLITTEERDKPQKLRRILIYSVNECVCVYASHTHTDLLRHLHLCGWQTDTGLLTFNCHYWVSHQCSTQPCEK